jgi:sporulation protein YlmC with PRC-barrel domain
MKRSTIRFRFLTPSIVAAVLALPATPALSQAVDEPERDLQQREQLRDTQLRDHPTELRHQEDPQQSQPREYESESELRQQPDSWTSKSGSYYEGSKIDPKTTPFRTGSMHSQFGTVEKASDIIGFDVMNAATGEKLATVDDLIVDLQSGKVVLAILRMGGLVGFGSDYVGVPPAALTPRAEESFTINGDKLQASPTLNWSDWEQALDHTTLARIYQTHGEEYHSDAFLGSRDMQMSHVESQPQREPDRDPNLDRQPVRGLEEQGQSQGRDHWGPAREGASAQSSRDWNPQGFIQSAESQSAAGMQLRRASDLIGADVESSTGEDLGSIKDLGVDMSNGRLVTAVVGSGGFLGLGQTTRAIPPMALKGGEEADEVMLDGSRALFDRAPTFSGRTWPLQDPAYVREVYDVFGVDPYFEEGARTAPPIPSTPQTSPDY